MMKVINLMLKSMIVLYFSAFLGSFSDFEMLPYSFVLSGWLLLESINKKYRWFPRKRHLS